MPYTYEFEQIGLSVDVAALAAAGGRLHVLSVRRRNPPYAGCWALPGGYVKADELFETAARREFREETGLAAGSLRPVGMFDAPGRDPRRRVATFAYYAPFAEMPAPSAGDDAAAVAWMPVATVRQLAFDHDLILGRAVAAARRDLLVAGTLPLFMPPAFAEDRLLEALAAFAPTEAAAEAARRLDDTGLLAAAAGGWQFADFVAARWLRALAPLADHFLDAAGQ